MRKILCDPSASTVSAAACADAVFVRAGLSGHGCRMFTSPGMTWTCAFVPAEGEPNADVGTLRAGASGRMRRTSTSHGTTERCEWSQLGRVEKHLVSDCVRCARLDSANVRSTLSGSCFAISVRDIVAAIAIATGGARVDVATLRAGTSGLERRISTSRGLKEMPQDSTKVLGSLVRSESGRGMMSCGIAELHTHRKWSNVPLTQRLSISHIATARWLRRVTHARTISFCVARCMPVVTVKMCSSCRPIAGACERLWC
ncbi:hypothetical protein B0H17DRAFT_298083 [Mycena rosella]|uniref:Uncharacterized protein n=1 Tax=Mycena rosella TaxID=1033263 RepID=A0AAD7DTZ2_MYCRO|nr:hypothetical protein B0H17DRAFT_298083 [Mycena rosella]